MKRAQQSVGAFNSRKGPSGLSTRRGDQIKIGDCILAERYQSHIYSRPFHRISDIVKLIHHRFHGPFVPENDDHCDGFVFVASQAAASKIRIPDELLNFIRIFICRHYPWHPCADQIASKLAKQLSPTCSPMMSDAKAGKLLSLRLTERESLEITTISPADMSADDFLNYRREKKQQRDRERQARKRRANGAIPLEQYRAQSLSVLKPWEKEGISRRTWERRRAAEKQKLAVEAAQTHHETTGLPQTRRKGFADDDANASLTLPVGVDKERDTVATLKETDSHLQNIKPQRLAERSGLEPPAREQSSASFASNRHPKGAKK